MPSLPTLSVGYVSLAASCARIDVLLTPPPPSVPRSAQFFYRMGRFPPPELNSRFQKLNMPNVEPKAFPQWAETCDEFGGLLQSAIEHVARMAATGASCDALVERAGSS